MSLTPLTTLTDFALIPNIALNIQGERLLPEALASYDGATSAVNQAWATLSSSSFNHGIATLFMAQDAGLTKSPAEGSQQTTASTQNPGKIEKGIINFSSTPSPWDGVALLAVIVLWEVGRYFFIGRHKEGADASKSLELTDKQFPGLQPHEASFLKEYAARPNRLFIQTDMWNPVNYEKKLRGMLGEFLGATPNLSDAFFDACMHIVDSYVELNPPSRLHLYDHRVEALFLQIALMIERVSLVKDERFDRIMERAAALYAAPALKFEIYAEGHGERATLKPGVTIELAKAAERWAFCHKLWEGEFGKTFFPNVAKALVVLSKDHPEETLGARLRLLEECWRNQYARSEIESELSKTFNTPGERKVLLERAKAAERDPRFRHLLLDIAMKSSKDADAAAAEDGKSVVLS